MAKMNLYFTGRRYHSARAKKAGSFVQVEPVGATRTFELESPEGIWRTFAALDLGSLDQVTYFFSRYGEPSGSVDEPAPDNFSTRDWIPLQRVLANAADTYTDDSRWDPERRSCIELYDDAEQKRLPAIEALDDFGPFAIRTPLGPNALDLRVATLADHLRLSARIFLGATVPMRRCAYCGFWISAEHKATRFCDAVCRNNAAKHRILKVRIG